jgi:hypothetical protein
LQGIPGTARAWALVDDNVTVPLAHNVTGVTRPTFGIYCVQLDSSVDAAATGRSSPSTRSTPPASAMA